MKRLTALLFLALLPLSGSVAPSKATSKAGSQPPSSAQPCPPPAVVASFLGFSEAQAAQFGQLLNQFQITESSLEQQISVLQTQLDNLLNQPQPDPTAVGKLVVEIHGFQQQVAQAIQGFQGHFASLLTPTQMDQLQQVTQAAQLQPVAGAFVALYLIPPPAPLSCQKQ